jgi:hypothetical protein
MQHGKQKRRQWQTILDLGTLKHSTRIMSQCWCCITFVGFHPANVFTPSETPLFQALAPLLKPNTITNPEEEEGWSVSYCLHIHGRIHFCYK